MSDSPEAYKAGDQVLFYAIGDSEPSEGEIIGMKELKAPCLTSSRDAEGNSVAMRLEQNEMGLVILSLKTGMTAGTFHKGCIVRKVGNRRRSE